ncbi:hypothetical protein [Teredinibacter turnerae]|uniref:hypothetical protein n=1 Tax=Teredinibacter turnerae TaxID=2426 RepID=UPI00035D9B50|nr:hypothetical protein [Teredinibacter turnerae]
MNYLRLAIRSSLCLITLLFAQISVAQTGAQAELDKLQARVASVKDSLETIDSRLEYYEVKKPDAETQLAEAQLSYQEAESLLAEAKASKEADAARAIDLANRRIELAERGLKSREGRLERTITKIVELGDEKKQLLAELSTLERQIAEKKERIAIIKEQKARAAVAAQAAPAPTPVPKPKPTPRPKPTPTPTPEPVAIEVVEEVAEAEATPEAEAESAPVPAPVAAAEDDASLKNLSPQARYARAQMKTLNRLLKEESKRRNQRYDELTVKVDRDDEIDLEHLGNEQYYAELSLGAGEHALTIKLRKYKVRIPAEQDGDMFVLIYDARDHRKPRFAFFNKGLLK